MRILLINPDTTASMTQKATVAAPGTAMVAAASRMGPVSIEGHYDGVLAIPGLLTALKAWQSSGFEAAIVACFDDTVSMRRAPCWTCRFLASANPLSRPPDSWRNDSPW